MTSSSDSAPTRRQRRRRGLAIRVHTAGNLPIESWTTCSVERPARVAARQARKTAAEKSVTTVYHCQIGDNILLQPPQTVQAASIYIPDPAISITGKVAASGPSNVRS